MRDEPLTYTLLAGQQSGTRIVKLTGPLTLSTMFPLQDELRAITPQVLILDLSGTPYMDSAGIGLIANCYVSAQRDGRKLVLAGTNARIEALLAVTKLDTLIKQFPTAEEAEASL